jgi:hypothetical protein
VLTRLSGGVTIVYIITCTPSLIAFTHQFTIINCLLLKSTPRITEGLNKTMFYL